MNRREFIKKSLGGILVSIPLISCSKNPVSSEPEYLNRYSVVKGNIVYSMQTDKYVYELGEDVKMLYKITNKRDEDMTVELLIHSFNEPCTFTVGKDGSEVYTNNPLRVIINQPIQDHSFTLRPNEVKEFYYNWDSKDREGKLVEAGFYNITGYLYLATENDNYCPVSVSINLKEWIHPF